MWHIHTFIVLIFSVYIKHNTFTRKRVNPFCLGCCHFYAIFRYALNITFTYYYLSAWDLSIFCIENWVFCNKVKIYGLAFYCMRQLTIEFIVISFSCIDANTNTMLIHFKVSTILFYFSFSWVIKLQYSLRFLFHFHYYSSSIILNSSIHYY